MLNSRFLMTAIVNLFFLSAYAQKNDTIFLNNGDRITGELKKFENGLLSLKTDAMQTITIEYDRIATIFSTKNFEFRTTSGYRYYGSILKSTTQGTVNLVTLTDTIPKPLWDIVQVTSIKNRFFQKIDGSIDLGINYTKASDVFQYSLRASVIHRTTDFATRFNLSSILSDRDDIISKNNDVGLDVTRYLPGKWFTRAETKYQQNTELDLNSRVQAGLGGGYDLVRNNSQRLYGLAGLLANRESTIDSSLVSHNLEALFSLQYRWFKYSQPKIDISSGFNLYPSLSTSGRVRFEYDLNAKIEIFKDVFFSVNLYENFDNNPATSSASNNDWGIITSLGYTF
jgi:sRNA-binding regulator protein Hfq